MNRKGTMAVMARLAAQTRSISTSQRTLRQPVRFSGIGLHTGRMSEIVVEPARIDYGIRFIHHAAVEPGPTTFTCQAKFTTTAHVAGTELLCVEHLMSGLHGLGITNARVRVLRGEEVPILDGSSLAFSTAILAAGVVAQPAQARALFVTKPVYLRDEQHQREVFAVPSDRFLVEATIVFPPPIGRQDFAIDVTQTSYLAEIAGARTFLKDSISKHSLDQVRETHLAGLGGPAAEDCRSIVYDDDCYHTRLRFADEPVRHKILDFIGDIFTSGYLVRGHFKIVRPGHAFSLRFVEFLTAASRRDKRRRGNPSRAPRARG
jgi:UDP-3-O-[3-hydroxymyristoyl] N-acetylglucosamine deacetylase